MRMQLGRVGGNRPVGLPVDEIEIPPSWRGRLGVRLPGSMSTNNSLPRIDVELLDTGEKVSLTSDIEVEVFED